MLEEYKRLSNVMGLKIPKKGDMSAMSRNMNAQHMSKSLPPQMLKTNRWHWRPTDTYEANRFKRVLKHVWWRWRSGWDDGQWWQQVVTKQTARHTQFLLQMSWAHQSELVHKMMPTVGTQHQISI
jgi:hypothetical protein